MYSQMMVARNDSGSNLASKIFTMSPEEENYRTKLRRVDSPDISNAVPGLALSFSKPVSGVFTFTAPVSGVFTFTASKNEYHLNPGGERGRGRMRCRVCNRPKLTKASLTTRKLRPFGRDDNTSQVYPFGTSIDNFKQSEPSRFIVNSGANDKFKDGMQPRYIMAAAESTGTACPNLFSMVPPDKQIHPVKKLEETDQIVRKASEMVKLLESRITALQMSAQALKTPSERMISVQGPPMDSHSNFKDEEPVNPFKQMNQNSPGTRMSAKHVANSCRQFSAPLPNFSPAVMFQCQTPSPTPSLSYTPSQSQSRFITFPCQTQIPTQSLSNAPSKPQCPAITCPCHPPSPSPNQIYTPSQAQSPAITCPSQIPTSSSLSYSPSQPKIHASIQIHEPSPKQTLSGIHSQKTSIPSPYVENIVQRLESLSVSPRHIHHSPNPTPKYTNEFTFPPLRTQSKVKTNNMYKTPPKASSAVSSSSGVVKQFKSSSKPSQTCISPLTRKARLPTSKLIRSHRLPPRQQHTSDYEDHSGSSVSSSSWTTTQQSGSGSESAAKETDAHDYSSSASHSTKSESSTTPESEDSTGSTSSSTSPINRPRLSISIPHSFNRHRSKKKPSVSNEKPISRLRKIKNKLGLIFHHHHHHHHHHHDEEPKPLKTKLPVVRHPHEAAAVKRRDHQGHFRSLFGGLMRHVRSNNKKKKSKPLKEIRRLQKKVQLGQTGKRRGGLKLPNINKKSKFKAIRK